MCTQHRPRRGCRLAGGGQFLGRGVELGEKDSELFGHRFHRPASYGKGRGFTTVPVRLVRNSHHSYDSHADDLGGTTIYRTIASCPGATIFILAQNYPQSVYFVIAGILLEKRG